MIPSRLVHMTMRTAAAAHPLLRAVQRRGYHATSSAEGSRAGNKDWPWIFGSAAVFVPIAYYVVSKTAHAHGEKIAHQADTSRNTLEKHEADVPEADPSKGLTQAKEESPLNEISHDELISTIERELKADAPKTAKEAEEGHALKHDATPAK